MDQFPDFLSPDFLTSHMREIMAFYHPRCLNTEDGGYYNEYRDDGFILDRKTQHIVSTTRFIFNYATAAVIFDRPDYAEAAAHGPWKVDVSALLGVRVRAGGAVGEEVASSARSKDSATGFDGGDEVFVAVKDGREFAVERRIHGRLLGCEGEAIA